jgi:hypothetical protein
LDLTPRLLRERTAAIYERVMAEHGSVEEVIFEIVRCDDCGVTQHLLTQGYPMGWTTEGDLEHGWTDRCHSCSRSDRPIDLQGR